MADPWVVIAVAALVELPGIQRSLVVYLAGRRGTYPERLSTSRAWKAAAWNFMLLGLIFWALSQELVRPEQVGLGPDHVLKSLFYGWLGWHVIQLVARVTQSIRTAEYGVREYVRTLRLLWPRTSSGRFAMLLVHILNPFTEEVVSRGVLVLMVHRATGSIASGVATGLCFCLLTHLYQGARSLFSHSIFFGVTVFLAYTDGGLGAAIVCHLFADLDGIVHRSEYGAWVRQERVSRRVKAAA